VWAAAGYLRGKIQQPMPIIAPSVLSADFANLERDVEMINQSEADWFHVDIMDGVFVPNLSFGLPVTKAIHRHAIKPLDVHLMIVDPDRYIGAFRDAGASMLTVHFEACTHLHRTIEAIHSAGMKAGVAINPHTPAAFLSEVLADLDLVLVMSVNPGFGGQQFIEHTYTKLMDLKRLREVTGSDALIEVDGGVNTSNASRLVESGADALVAGNFVFSSPDPSAAIASMKRV